MLLLFPEIIDAFADLMRFVLTTFGPVMLAVGLTYIYMDVKHSK